MTLFRFQRWKRELVRNVIGFTNLTLALIGFSMILFAFWGSPVFSHWEAAPNGPIAYGREAFYVLSLINIVFLVGMIVGGIKLFRNNPAAIQFNNMLYFSILAYEMVWPTGPLYLLVGEAVNQSIGAAQGIGNMGLSFTVLTGYPIIAAILLKVDPWRTTS